MLDICNTNDYYKHTWVFAGAIKPFGNKSMNGLAVKICYGGVEKAIAAT